MKAFRDIRVMPVVVVAIFGFAVVKIAGLVIDGGYVFDYDPQSTQRSWAQENLNFPTGKTDPADITGSVDEKAKEDKSKEEKKEEEAPKPAAPEAAAPKPDGTDLYPTQVQPVSASERAILERLQSRRQELDARAREMKAVESRISTATEQKTEADAARFKGIVTMYESMKPKDAAKVFDRLEMPVLFEIASKIAPRKMSDILGLMSPEVAERLTTEMARRAGGSSSASDGDLPKIEGKVLSQKPN
jgi:flagellar motility protein MotE (MotC chaperone)